MNKNKYSVIHLIPTNTIGGVELAAASIPSGQHGALHLEKYFLVSNPPFDNPETEDYYGPSGNLNNPRIYLVAIRRILAIKPDLVVASLWRSVVVMIICKILRPSLKTVIFLHNTGTSHSVDKIVNAIGIRLATQIWTDSTATLNARLGHKHQKKSKVVSFLIKGVEADAMTEIKPDFIFWGRLRVQKNVRRSVALFQKIREKFGEASFRLIGPDGGDEANIADEIRKSFLEDSVKILGPMNHAQISDAARSATFYLQTSINEGMSMSVVEAMQRGLIPVVTPVGEIAHYCQDGVNAILIEDDARAADAISALIKDPDRARAMAKAAIDTWREKPVYREDFLRYASAMLNCSDDVDN